MKKILVVEDEPNFSLSIYITLIESGHDPIRAENADAAADIISKPGQLDMLIINLDVLFFEKGALNTIWLAKTLRRNSPMRIWAYMLEFNSNIALEAIGLGAERVVEKKNLRAELISQDIAKLPGK